MRAACGELRHVVAQQGLQHAWDVLVEVLAVPEPAHLAFAPGVHIASVCSKGRGRGRGKGRGPGCEHQLAHPPPRVALTLAGPAVGACTFAHDEAGGALVHHDLDAAGPLRALGDALGHRGRHLLLHQRRDAGRPHLVFVSVLAKVESKGAGG